MKEEYLVDGKYLSEEECKELFSNGLAPLAFRQKKCLDLIEGDNIIDIGCYCGSFVYNALKKYPKKNIIGIDYCGNNIRIAKLLYPKIKNRFKKMSVYNMKYNKHSFDCVILQEVLEHLEGAAMAIKNINHILIPNGVLIISIPNLFYWKNLFSFIISEFKNMIIKRKRKINTEIFYKNVEWNRHIYSWSINTIMTLLEVNGFRYVNHYYVNESKNKIKNIILKALAFFSSVLIIKIKKNKDVKRKLI